MRQFIITYIIDHKVHYCFWNEISNTFVDDRHVGVYEVANGLHLPLQLWVHGKVFCLAILIIFSLTERKENMDYFTFVQKEKKYHTLSHDQTSDHSIWSSITRSLTPLS